MSVDNFEMIMEDIIYAHEQAGYDPREQIYGYIQTGKLQYITRHNDARKKIEHLSMTRIWQYINSRFR